MGFGGSAADAGRALGRSGDDGVDGVIDQDRPRRTRPSLHPGQALCARQQRRLRRDQGLLRQPRPPQGNQRPLRHHLGLLPVCTGNRQIRGHLPICSKSYAKPVPPSGGASPSRHSVEQFSEQPLALRQSLIRQHNGLRLADWIFDHALAMQSDQHLPVVPLPGTGSSCRVSWSNASTVSSILSVSMATAALLV